MTWLTGKNNSKGFTLVEIMISVVILGAGLSFVVNSYILSVRGLNTVSNNINALNLAREQMQELELSGLGKGLQASSSEGTLKWQQKEYEYSREVVEFAGPEELSKNLLQACLKISWKDQNLVKNAVLSTYVPKEKQE